MKNLLIFILGLTLVIVLLNMGNPKSKIAKDRDYTDMPETHKTLPPGWGLACNSEGKYAAMRNGQVVEVFPNQHPTRAQAIERAWDQVNYEEGKKDWKECP